jgi:very-short-patch-repair endonuclease
MMAHSNPPRNGEGDHAQRGGGGSRPAQRPEVYFARNLRQEMSLPEVLLWERLRGAATGVKFRRQHPIGPYVADFYCSALKLVLEVDGKGHDHGDRPKRDLARDAFLKENGYEVVRVAAVDILKNADDVAQSIATLVANPLHHQPAADGPPPRTGEDLGAIIPPRHGEGDHAKRGGGGSPSQNPALPNSEKTSQ